MRLRKWLLILIPLLAVSALLYWLATHSFIEIEVSGESGAYNYFIKNQASLEELSHQNEPKNTIRKFVSRGEYEILITGNEQSYFEVVKTGWFLSTTKVEATLKNQKERSFVGDNPSPCMQLVEDTLLSYACSGSYSNTKIHIPATKRLPSYIQAPDVSEVGSIESMFTIDDKTYVVLYIGAQDFGFSHTLYTVKENGDIENPRHLTSLSADDRHTILVVGRGFIAYNQNLSSVWHYETVTAGPKKINIPPSPDESLVPQIFDVRNEQNLIVYGTSIIDESVDLDHPEESGGRSEIIITRQDSVKRYSFNKIYSAVKFCGDNKLCLLSGGDLEVFDISGGKSTYLFRVNDIKDIFTLDGKLLIAKDSGIFELDLENRNGYQHYNFGDYTYCGSRFLAGTYLLCVFYGENKSAILVDSSTENTDSIDKKILDLAQAISVSKVSVYRQHIFVSPNLGEPTYIKSLGGYGYSDDTINKTKQSITQLFNEAGISLQKYNLILPYK